MLSYLPGIKLMVTVSDTFEDINPNAITAKALTTEIQRKCSSSGLTAETLFTSMTFRHLSLYLHSFSFFVPVNYKEVLTPLAK
jgi:hypothetical protein